MHGDLEITAPIREGFNAIKEAWRNIGKGSIEEEGGDAEGVAKHKITPQFSMMDTFKLRLNIANLHGNL